MAQTPLTGSTPYLTAARFWLYRDFNTVVELLSDDGSIASKADAEDDATTPGGRLLAALQSASGEVEEHAMRGGKYLPVDLAALTGNIKHRLEELVADLAFWKLGKRRWPMLRAEEASGVVPAIEALQRLADGQTIFGTVEAVDASINDTATTDPGDDTRTIRAAARFFGSRERE